MAAKTRFIPPTPINGRGSAPGIVTGNARHGRVLWIAGASSKRLVQLRRAGGGRQIGRPSRQTISRRRRDSLRATLVQGMAAGVRDDFTAPDGTTLPIGDIHFDIGGVQIGFEICEDAWVANRPGATLALHGIDLILNPSASHFAFGKLEVRKRFVLEGSRAFGVSYVYSNLLGNEAGRAIYDGGALIASGGKLVAAGPRFSFEDSSSPTR